MKYYLVTFIFVFVTLMATAGCDKFNSAANTFNSSDKKTDNNARKPVALDAKMVNNFVIASNSEIISDETNTRGAFGPVRDIKLNVSSPFYDVANFYCTEMSKRGWTLESQDECPPAQNDILSFLTFKSETQEARVIVRTGDKDGSKVEVHIQDNKDFRQKKQREESDREDAKTDEELEKIKNGFPLPDCAEQSNRLLNSESLKYSVECPTKINELSKFFTQQAAQNNWRLKNSNNQNQDSETVVLVFEKGSQKSLVTLIGNNDSTGLNVQISRPH